MGRSSDDVRTRTKGEGFYPEHIEVEITLRCTLRCRHCCVAAGDKIDLPAWGFRKLVLEAEKLGTKIIDVIGGEPLVRKDIYELLSFAAAHVPNVWLNTAGYFITKEMAQKIKQSGVKSISISLDGPDAETHEFIRGRNGIFDKTVDRIKMLADIGFDITVSFVATKTNYTRLAEMVELVRSLGARRLFVLGFIATGRGAAVEQELGLDAQMRRTLVEQATQLKKSTRFPIVLDCSLKDDFSSFTQEAPTCPGGTYFMAITARGDVYPCDFLREDKRYYSGNILRQPLREIWEHGEGMKRIRTPNPKCLSCPIFARCRGGCRGRFPDSLPCESTDFVFRDLLQKVAAKSA